MTGNMPAAEVPLSTSLVRSLLRRQRPDLADLELRPLAHGWDNASFRVGDHLVARLPRRKAAAGLIEHEARWLPLLAPHLPLDVPVPTFVGTPDESYPWRWALVPWIPGESAAISDSLELQLAAEDLGRFLRALHVVAPLDAPENPFRGIPLQARDKATRQGLARLGAMVDQGAALEMWDSACGESEFEAAPVWLHGDLHPDNLLVSRGRIRGVIDFGDITSGDPATDLSVAWMLFPPDLRLQFREAYGSIDDVTWRRPRLGALPGGRLSRQLRRPSHGSPDRGKHD